MNLGDSKICKTESQKVVSPKVSILSFGLPDY